MKKIRVLVADDHALFREGLCRLLKNEKDVDCIAIAENGEEAITLAKELLPDVVLIDVAMATMDVVDVAKQIKVACSTTAIVILTHSKSEHSIVACLQAGVDGYLLKDTPRIELINAIRMVHAGGGVFNLQATSKVLRDLATGKDKEEIGLGELHNRELQVLKLAARGMTNKEIAGELGISDHTVGTHFVNIFRKMGVESRTEATLHALKEGWFSIDDLT